MPGVLRMRPTPCISRPRRVRIWRHHTIFVIVTCTNTGLSSRSGHTQRVGQPAVAARTAAAEGSATHTRVPQHLTRVRRSRVGRTIVSMVQGYHRLEPLRRSSCGIGIRHGRPTLHTVTSYNAASCCPHSRSDLRMNSSGTARDVHARFA
jgi:hypothetical protein